MVDLKAPIIMLTLNAVVTMFSYSIPIPGAKS